VTLILVVRKAVSLVISLKGRALWEEVTRYSGVNIDSIMQEYGYQLDGLWTSAAWFLKAALGVDDEGVVKKRAVPQVDEEMLWTGAGLVLLGTIGYTIGTGFRSSKGKAKKE
jgi:UDP-xylose/UDP-N-acetylglucosamine transporter B4